jgi:hypothetical protein
MPHPLEFLPPNLRKPFFYFFLALTLSTFVVFRFLDEPLQPNGIVSFELAGNADSAQRMVDSWDADARLFAAFGLGFDYLFMPIYALALSLGLLLARGQNPSRYHSFANLMGWGALAAALFDAVENYALWHTLTQNAISPYPQLAATCAVIKFALLILGFIAAAAGKLTQ